MSNNHPVRQPDPTNPPQEHRWNGVASDNQVRLPSADPEVAGEDIVTADAEAIAMLRRDGFEVMSRLGSGGSGIVYLATSSGGRKVAIKVLRPEFAEDERLRGVLAREAAALAAVRGARAVKVFKVEATGPAPYIVMEYIDGGSLESLVRSGERLSGPRLWFTALGLVEALQEIHAAGIIHRDLKPSNVLLGSNGVKVVDFGISTIVDEVGSTRTGMFAGSALWLSPEQVSGARLSQATDVFNLGLVLSYMSSGRHPYGDGRPDALMYRVVHLEPDLSSVPAPLLSIVSACLRKDPTERPDLETLRGFISSGGLGALATPSESRSVPRDDTMIVRPAPHVVVHTTTDTLMVPAPMTGPVPMGGYLQIHSVDEPLGLDDTDSRWRPFGAVVVVAVLGVLALIAVPSFKGIISSTTGEDLTSEAAGVVDDAPARSTTPSTVRSTTSTVPVPPAFKVEDPSDGKTYRWDPCGGVIEIKMSSVTDMSAEQQSSVGRFLQEQAVELSKLTGLGFVYAGLDKRKTSTSTSGDDILLQFGAPGQGLLSKKEAETYASDRFFTWGRSRSGDREITSVHAHVSTARMFDTDYLGMPSTLNNYGKWLIMHHLGEAAGLLSLDDKDMDAFGVPQGKRTSEVMYWYSYTRGSAPTWGNGDRLGLLLVGGSHGCF